MKKKLLFVIPSLRSGGAEKSLISLLQTLDYTQYDADLFLFRREGLFLPLVPQQVRVMDAGTDYRMFDGDARNAVRYFLKHGKPITAYRRFLYAKAQALPQEQRVERAWKYLSAVLPPLQGYDTAIAYLEGTATYYVTDCVRAEKKIAFLHTDYDHIIRHKQMDTPYYKKLDALVSVSQACCEKAAAHFPFVRDKLLYLPNIISPTVIREMARQEAELPVPGKDATLVTVGRLVGLKRLDRAICACSLLTRRGLDVRWYVIGSGIMERELRDLAREKGVDDRFVFLGEKSNPYPFLNMCDIYVQTSEVEGKSIAIDEAKCMAKPIVVTNFETVYDQICDGVTGSIVPMESEAIADAIERLIRAPETRERYTQNLLREKVGTEDEIRKLYAIL